MNPLVEHYIVFIEKKSKHDIFYDVKLEEGK